MKTFILSATLFILMGLSCTVFGQDVIYCKDGSILKAKIQRVDTTKVYYHLYPRDLYPNLRDRELVSIDSIFFDKNFKGAVDKPKFKPLAKHAITGEFSISMVGVGVGYSGTIINKEKFLFTGGGALGYSFYGSVVIKADFSVCFGGRNKNGKGGHYVELGAMGCLIPSAVDTYGTFTPLYVGYRYQPPKSGFHVRVNLGAVIGIEPYFFPPVLPTLNFSIGAAF